MCSFPKARVKLVESPRDAWQGLPKTIPPEIKADYLRLLVAAGFRHIDAVSFLSPTDVPQMADSEQVLKYFDAAMPEIPLDLEMIGLVADEEGAERAIATGVIQTLAFPYSVSPTFLKHTQGQTLDESLDALESVGQAAFKSGLDIVAYISMAFGNPYGDGWDIEEVLAACELLTDLGIHQISLADTSGLATPRLIEDLASDLLAVHSTLDIGLHLHARPNEVAQKVAAAYRPGIRRLDVAIGGLGGCPLAQDALMGNIDTALAIAELARLGADVPDFAPLDGIAAANQAIGRKYGPLVQ